MFTLFGWAGQHGYNYLDAKNSSEIQERARGENKPKENFMHKIAKSKWSPMQVLTDDDYENMMQEKLLRVEAQIAVIDDKIDVLKKQAFELETQRKMKEIQEQGQATK